ncbi:hypothetical protein [Deinococcus hopiensis]|uniref:DUF2325 domain-containing protein n=1 Tax=Deinococcus hopiensis KR-140 TaxID=695939 RepID=A0A1W1UQC6_9DEIO|nr:hypothetical protein [Deinococcus hopiensis]SMB83348.1 hypothetical protein SAMN00790413_04376 [Deinococcus hopiensis KR-140]
MARLRTPDGRILQAPTSTLHVTAGQGHFQDPPGGLTRSPETLTPFLQAGERLLDGQMNRAENDETLSVQQQEHTIQSVLLGQAVIVGLAGYAAGGNRELLELLNDLATTLDVISPLGRSYLQRLPAINGAAGLGGLEGVALLPEEYPHAVSQVLERGAQAGVVLTPEAQARLDWAGHRTPFPPKDPLHPSRAALTPPATLERERMARERELRRLSRSSLEGERNAALLLLHVNGRDRLENAPLVGVLDTAQVLLLHLQRQHREEERESGTADALLTLHAQLHRELGAPRLPGTQRFKRQPGSDAEGQTWRARRRLRALRADRWRAPTPLERQQRGALWDALNALDRDLASGITPAEDEHLKARLLLLGLQGLTTTYRAPGMNLPPMVQLAAQVSGIDPLWAWERTQPQDHLSTDLRAELQLLIHCGLLLGLDGTAYWETWGQQVRRLTALAAGHLFATVRRAGLRLPEQTFLETYFGRLGPLRALPLSAGEWEGVQKAAQEVLAAAARPLEAAWEREQQEEAGDDGAERPPQPSTPADPTAQNPSGEDERGDAFPPHVLAARERLAGQRVVLLGSVPSPPHRAALVRALRLRELDWIGSGEYAHGTHAHAHVTEDTAVVILAIRWMGHAHNTLRDVAKARGVPFVMHPGGLSPSSVAWQIMQQVSGQLQGRTDLPPSPGPRLERAGRGNDLRAASVDQPRRRNPSPPRPGIQRPCALLRSLSPSAPPDAHWARLQVLTRSLQRHGNVSVKRWVLDIYIR